MSWQTAKLGDLCEISRGGSPRPIQSYLTDAEDGLNWIKIGDVNVGDKYIVKTEEKIKPAGLSATRQVQAGDFLLSNSMSFGRPYISKINGCIHDGWLMLRDTNNNFSQDYLYHMLSSPAITAQFKKFATGAVVKNLNKDIVSNVLVPLPTIAEQKRIAAILDKAAEIKAKREQAIAKLDELAQSTFVEMFGTNPSNSSNGQLIKLSDLCDLQNGYAFKSTDYVESSSVLNCRMSNIRPNGDFDILYSAKYLPNSFAEKHKSFLLADGDVIIAMTDMAGEPKILGVPTIVDTKGYKLLLNQRVGKLTFNNKKSISIIYLKYALSQPYVKKYYRQFAGGGVQINLGKTDLLSINLLLPNYDEQMIFEKKIKSIEQQKMKYMNALSVCSETQSSLQHQAFTSGFDA